MPRLSFKRGPYLEKHKTKLKSDTNTILDLMLMAAIYRSGSFLKSCCWSKLIFNWGMVSIILFLNSTSPRSFEWLSLLGGRRCWAKPRYLLTERKCFAPDVTKSCSSGSSLTSLVHTSLSSLNSLCVYCSNTEFRILSSNTWTCFVSLPNLLVLWGRRPWLLH